MAAGAALRRNDRSTTMLTFQDCLDYCGLTEGGLRVIAHHEQLDGNIAMALSGL